VVKKKKVTTVRLEPEAVAKLEALQKLAAVKVSLAALANAIIRQSNLPSMLLEPQNQGR
jgi:hypothetical protein